MAQIPIPYGTGSQMLLIDDKRLNAVLCPICPKHEMDQQSLVQAALENPIDSPRLCTLSEGKRRILLITSDHTRPVPSKVTLPLYLAEIRKGNPEAEITILIATGLHRPSTEEELRAKLGDEVFERETIAIHKAGNTEDMAYFGMLPSGGEVWLNKLVQEADLVIAEGFIEPHFFAGFSGGRKSILPGVAAKQTILFNHNAAFIQNPFARQGHLDDNPVHLDMLAAARMARLSFVLNVLIDDQKRVIAAFAGHPEATHLRGTELSRQLTQVPCVKADIVITSNGGYPLDQNVYQCVKGMTAAETCVHKGGIIILCASLSDGHGGEAFYRWFAERNSAHQVAKDIEQISADKTSMDQWEAQILARVLEKAECVFVTDEKNRSLIEHMHMRWAPDVNSALEMADNLLGRKPNVTVIPDGVGVIVCENQ